MLTEKKKSVNDTNVLPVFVPNKHVFLHLDNKICRPGHLCTTAVLHNNAVLSHILLPLSKKCGICNLDIALVLLIIVKLIVQLYPQVINDEYNKENLT